MIDTVQDLIIELSKFPLQEKVRDNWGYRIARLKKDKCKLTDYINRNEKDEEYIHLVVEE